MRVLFLSWIRHEVSQEEDAIVECGELVLVQCV